ncbi:MAG: RNA polymerase sigma factor [Bacillota bacterium]
MLKNRDNFLTHYNQFKDKIFNYFLYRTGFDRALAEDLTSEVFMKALKAYDGFDRNKPFQPWIFTIAHNHLINHYSQAAKATFPLDEFEDLMPEEDNHEVEIRYEVEQVMKAMESMSFSDQEVLKLKFIEQLDNQEITEILDKDEGAVRTQISRCLKRLRRILGDMNKIE